MRPVHTSLLATVVVYACIGMACRTADPVEYYVAEIQPGKVLYEMDGVAESLAREAFALAAAKLPIPTAFVARQVGK